jgi:hypothetical protein
VLYAFILSSSLRAVELTAPSRTRTGHVRTTNVVTGEERPRGRNSVNPLTHSDPLSGVPRLGRRGRNTPRSVQACVPERASHLHEHSKRCSIYSPHVLSRILFKPERQRSPEFSSCRKFAKSLLLAKTVSTSFGFGPASVDVLAVPEDEHGGGASSTSPAWTRRERCLTRCAGRT